MPYPTCGKCGATEPSGVGWNWSLCPPCIRHEQSCEDEHPAEDCPNRATSGGGTRVAQVAHHEDPEPQISHPEPPAGEGRATVPPATRVSQDGGTVAHPSPATVSPPSDSAKEEGGTRVAHDPGVVSAKTVEDDRPVLDARVAAFALHNLLETTGLTVEDIERMVEERDDPHLQARRDAALEDQRPTEDYRRELQMERVGSRLFVRLVEDGWPTALTIPLSEHSTDGLYNRLVKSHGWKPEDAMREVNHAAAHARRERTEVSTNWNFPADRAELRRVLDAEPEGLTVPNVLYKLPSGDKPTVLVGSTGVGKTTVAAGWVEGLAGAQGVRTLVMATESAQKWARLAINMDVPDNMVPLVGYRTLTETHIAQMARIAEEHNVGLVVIDTYAQALGDTGLEENDATTWGHVRRLLRPLMEGRSLLVIAHYGKDRRLGTRGSSAVESGASVVVGVSRDDDLPDTVIVEGTKANDIDLFTGYPPFVYAWEDGRLAFQGRKKADGPDPSEPGRAEFEEWEAKNTDMGKEYTYRELKGGKTRIRGNDTTRRAAIKWGIANGRMEKNEKGRYKRT